MDEEKFDKWGDDSKVFENLFKYYYPKLMAYCRLMLEEDVARDVVQDVFVYVWVNRERLNLQEGIQAYLYRCAYSKCLDVLKHRSMVHEKFSGVTDKLLNTELAWLKGHQSDVIADLDKKDLYKRVNDLIQKLPVNRRKVFLLSFDKEMSNDEISELLEMPKRTVESHLYLALKYLRGKLTEEEMWALLLFMSLNHL